MARVKRAPVHTRSIVYYKRRRGKYVKQQRLRDARSRHCMGMGTGTGILVVKTCGSRDRDSQMEKRKNQDGSYPGSLELTLAHIAG